MIYSATTKPSFLALSVTLILLLLSAVALADTNKYRLLLRDDPATTAVVAWNQLSGENPTVRYGTEDLGADYAAYPNSQAPDRVVEHKSMNNHFVRISGLSPNTAYYFVIHDSEGTSERFWF
ncbi:MAG TPA: hypothetical protein DCR93_27110, partial [Cytophagales bacterium]|nr:hypothetical protein [Cytophagales bacterium]